MCAAGRIPEKRAGVIEDLGFGIWDLGFGIWDLGFGIWDLGFGIWDLGFCPSSLDLASRSSYAVAPRLPSPRCYAETSRNSGATGLRGASCGGGSGRRGPFSSGDSRFPRRMRGRMFLSSAFPRIIANFARFSLRKIAKTAHFWRGRGVKRGFWKSLTPCRLLCIFTSSGRKY